MSDWIRCVAAAFVFICFGVWVLLSIASIAFGCSQERFRLRYIAIGLISLVLSLGTLAFIISHFIKVS